MRRKAKATGQPATPMNSPPTTNTPRSIVGVPGVWPSRTALVQAVAGESGGYLLAGRVLRNLATAQNWELEVYDQDPNLPRAFALAGRGSVTDADLEAIAAHTCTAYVLWEGSSVGAAQHMMDAACALLRAGGLAVKVESAGKAHSARDWIALAERREPRALYEAFVILIGGNGEGYSCGMQNLGLPDAAVRGVDSDEDGARLLQAFLLYTLLERPVLRTGHTFGLRPQSASFRLTHVVCDRYAADDPFFNPYGLWHLSPA